MTLLKDNNFKDINVALLSLEADIKNKISGFDTSVIDKQLAEINSRIDKINAGDNNTSDEIEDINSKLNRNSNKIRNIEQNIEDIDTKIDDIEQKLSDIFSAENKVTDFNTTTDSGIYFWLTDAANKPGTDYGVLLVNKYDRRDNNSIWINQVAYGTNNKIYFRQNINRGNWTEWKAVAFEGEGRASFLDEYVGAGGTRLTSGNIVPKDSSEYGGMRKDVVTDSMTDSGRPGQDGHLLTMFWDNTGRFDTQFYISNDGNHPGAKIRWKSNGTDYGPWTDIITSNNIGSQTVASAGNAGTADSLFYRHGNEINFKGGAPNACYFNYRNADTGDPSPVDTMQYVFCNYSNDTSKSVIKAGSFDGNKLTIQGVTVGSNSYTDTNPKIEFKNVDGSQSISLTFTDFDAVQAPASLTLNGNQGNEYFIAPCIKANNKMVIPIGEPSSLEDGCIWIER